MFAVIKTGGKQYRVAKNDLLTVERLAGEAGGTVDLDSVLMIGGGDTTRMGAPHVEGARVSAEIVEQARSKKITVFKKKRRKHYRLTAGHRQDLTVLRINDILVDGASVATEAAPKKSVKTSKGEATQSDAE